MASDSAKKNPWGDKWRESLEGGFPAYLRSAARAADVQISGRTVNARIVGDSWNTQKVVLLFSRFSEEEEANMLTALKRLPELSNSLAHHLEPDEALELAVNNGMKLFPGAGVKFSVKCSCGMRGMCKHTYAALAGLGKKIDKNPFLLFSLRGLDMAVLAKQSAEAEWEGEIPDEAESIPAFGSYFALVPRNGSEEIPDVPEFEETGIPDVRKALRGAVYANAVFSAEFVDDFRDTLKAICSDNFERYPENSVDLSVKGDVRYMGENRWTFGKAPLEWALDAVSVESPTGMSKADASARLLSYAQKTAGEILNRGAVYPKLFLTGEKTAQFFWLPLFSMAEVRKAAERLQRILPAKFVRSELEFPGKMVQNSAEVLLVAILSTYMRRSSDRKFKDDRLYAFFGKATLEVSDRTFDGISEIRKWLSGYELFKARYAAIVNGADAGFGKVDVDLDFADRETGEVSPYSQLWKWDFPKERRGRILQDSLPLCEYLPGYAEYISGKAHDNIHLSGESLIRFLNESVPLFRALGVELDLPPGIDRVVRGIPQPQIVRSEEKVRAGFCRLENLLQLNWSVSIGEKSMDGKQFLKLYEESKDLLYFEGQYFYVTGSDVERLKAGLRDRFKVPAIKVLQIALAGEFEGLSVQIAPEALSEIRKLQAENDVPTPPQIHATLRPYQWRGFSWMLGNSRLGFGSILADDMGLGKTLQVITLLQQMKNEGAFEERKALIIVPTGLLQNWKRELSKFAPELRFHIYHGQSRRFENAAADIFITTYGVLRSDRELFSKADWQVAIIDEAQNIKNAGTSQSRAVRAVSAHIKIAMSGTPVENRLMEFWSIMDFCNRGFFGGAKAFREEFEKPIQDRGNKHRAELFRKVTAPFLLRRLKTDKSIIADLPEKLEQDEWAALSSEQETLYNEVFNSMMQKIGTFDKEDSAENFERSGVVLRAIVALKQICNHPAQYLKDGHVAAERSGKMELFLDILESILDTDEKTLVFTQFTAMGEILEKVIQDKFKVPVLFYHGGMSLSNREKVVSEFENIPEKRILILSLKAGGTGLNLTSASQVVHYDLWWNPAVESQATDRAYRIGQSRRVVVHRLITKDSFEEKINDIIESKKKISEMTVATGENWIARLSDEELREVFTLGKG